MNIKVGQKYQTMASNSNQIYRVKEINELRGKILILFEMSPDGINFNGTHNLSLENVNDYIERKRMILI